MIDRTRSLPITRQAQIVGISRGSVYYENEPPSEPDLKLMRRIDELHLELPFAGARMLRDLLRAEGLAVGRKHMTTLMWKARESEVQVFIFQFSQSKLTL